MTCPKRSENTKAQLKHYYTRKKSFQDFCRLSTPSYSDTYPHWKNPESIQMNSCNSSRKTDHSKKAEAGRNARTKEITEVADRETVPAETDEIKVIPEVQVTMMTK